MIINALTIDVEDYFQLHAFSDVIRYEDWGSFTPRVERNTYRILDLLDSIETDQRSEVRSQRSQIPDNGPRITDHGQHKKVRCTFFVLGWIADRFPHIIKEIHARGHEVACHGYSHKVIFNQTQEEFRDDVRRAKELLENIINEKVIGYRAPTYSITKRTMWALEVLYELGFKYDSSIFPIKHDVYGMPESPRFPYVINFDVIPAPHRACPEPRSGMRNKLQPWFDRRTTPSEAEGESSSAVIPENARIHPSRHSGLRAGIQYDRHSGYRTGTQESRHSPRRRGIQFLDLSSFNDNQRSIIEVPMATTQLFGKNIPAAGGGYFRLFPYFITRYFLKRINNTEGRPFVFYIHPWEIDPDIPRIKEARAFSRFRTYVNLDKTFTRFKRLLSDFHFTSLSDFLFKT
jgi:peptidoglycan/xylan/chitin deacetylase (PgdA/CDA1 family)